MVDERAHRAMPGAVTGVGLAEHIRGMLEREPPLARPRLRRMERVHRSCIAAFWQARMSVRAGVPLDDFLRSRLARYLAALDAPRSCLPLSVEVEDGVIEVRPTEAPAPPPLPAEGEAWLHPLVAAEGPAARQEVGELEVRLAVLDGALDGARRRAEDLSHRLAADVAAGLVAAPAPAETTAEQMGRPPVRSPAGRVAAVGFAGAAVSAETWQIALPLFRTAGVDPLSLGEELGRKPAEVVFVAIFALGVATGIFALLEAGLRAAAALVRGECDARRRRWLAAASAGSAALATIMAASLAALPPGASPGAPPASFALLLLAVPLAATLLLAAARRVEEARAGEVAAALVWDRERARALAERERRVEELSRADDEVNDLERRREAARRRLRELNARAIAAARIAAEAHRMERDALARVAQSLVGALELDRWEFVRQASARGMLDLVARRRRDGHVHAPSFEPAERVGAAVEPGRMAS